MQQLTAVLRRLAPERPSRRDLLTFGGYVLAGAVYIAIGVAETDFLLSFWVALVYVVVATWAVPAAVRRLLPRIRRRT